MIKPVDLPETSLILGDHFPVHDETGYAREADGQYTTAGHTQDAAMAAHAAAAYTEPNFRGQSGTRVTELMTAHHETLSGDAERHSTVADLLTQGADNITRTKNSMNDVSEQYHTDYARVQKQAVAETWPQHKLQSAKAQLVNESQHHVAELRTRFDDTHNQVRSGIVQSVADTRDNRCNPFDEHRAILNPPEPVPPSDKELPLPGSGPKYPWPNPIQRGDLPPCTVAKAGVAYQEPEPNLGAGKGESWDFST